MDEQIKLTQKFLDVMQRANRNICATLLRYNVEKPEGHCYAHVRIFANKKEDKNFQQVVFVNYELEEIIYLLDVIISVYDIF